MYTDLLLYTPAYFLIAATAVSIKCTNGTNFTASYAVIAVISPPKISIILFVGAPVRLLANELEVFLSWVLARLRKRLVISKCATADKR